MANTKLLSPIDKFVSRAASSLKRDLPAEKLQTVVAEARCHLEDSAADFAAAGLDPIEAENKAVQTFGGYEKWTRSIVDAFYVDARTQKADAVAWVCAAILLCLPPVQTVFNCIFLGSMIDIAMGALIIMYFWARFLSRNNHHRYWQVYFVALAITFFVFSTQWTAVDKSTIPRWVVSRDLQQISAGYAHASTDSQSDATREMTDTHLVPLDLWRKEPLWSQIGVFEDRDTSVAALKEAAREGQYFDARAGFTGVCTANMVSVLLTCLDTSGVYLGRLVFRTLKRRNVQTS